MDAPRIIGEVSGSTRSINKRRLAGDRLNRAIVNHRFWLIMAPIITLAQARGSYLSRMLRHVVLVLLVGTVTAHPQDASWHLTPGSSDWNTDANWTPAVTPTGTATFDASNTTAITFLSPFITTFGTLQFNAGAPAYFFNLSVSNSLFITGTGIVNNSSNSPHLLGQRDRGFPGWEHGR